MKTKERIIEETKEHIKDVELLLHFASHDLYTRARHHDYTKLVPRNAQVLADCLNGDADWREWDRIHFKVEDHHPEYFDKLEDMTLFNLMEQVADGCAANFRRSKELGTWQGQYDFYTKRKGFDHLTASIMANTFMQFQAKLIKEEQSWQEH